MKHQTAIDWVNAGERLPTAQDADRAGCVLVWHKYSGVMVTGFHQFEHNTNGFLTHWAPKPKPPYGFPEWEDEEGEDTT